MIIRAFDWETKDLYISSNNRNMGLGAIYKYHNYQNCDFKLLGCAFYDKESGSDYITELSDIRRKIETADIIVAHNLMYDLSCLLAAGMEDLVNQYYGKSVCTLLAAKLTDNRLMSYSLDNCAGKWVGGSKLSQEMYELVYTRNIYPLTKKEIKENTIRKEIPPTIKSRVRNWTMSNLDIIQEEDYNIVADYAKMDAKLCYDLLQALLKDADNYYDNPLETFLDYSKLVHVYLDCCKKGIRIDLEKLDQAEQTIIPRIRELEKSIYKEAGIEFNYKSSQQLAAVFESLGLKVKITEKGNKSVDKYLLADTNHDIAKFILEAKKLQTLRTGFIHKMQEIQQYTMKQDETPDRDIGIIHPVIMPLGAVATGRSSSNGPNIQQINKRDKELQKWTRAAFLPASGKKWISADYSNQEGRLQVHWACKLGCTGSKQVKDKFIKDPNYDMHQDTADMMNIERGWAKAMNHGLTYGMGQAKLCKSLGLPTKHVSTPYGIREVAGNEGQAVLNEYFEMVPYLKELDELFKNSYTNRNYLRTIGNRVVLRDFYFENGKKKYVDYKALNKGIQGGAADQTNKAMKDAYEAGIDLIACIHDEICASGTEEDAAKLKSIMENAIQLEVPSVADIVIGETWRG